MTQSSVITYIFILYHNIVSNSGERYLEQTVFRIQNVYGSQHRITTAKFMFLSYQKPSCKLYFSRTRALKNKAVLGLAKKNLVIITQLGFSVELTPINSYFGMGSQIPNYVKKLVYTTTKLL